MNTRTPEEIQLKAEHLTNFTVGYLEQLIEENELYLEQVSQKQFFIEAAKVALELKSEARKESLISPRKLSEMVEA
jgi:hypothetical protein